MRVVTAADKAGDVAFAVAGVDGNAGEFLAVSAPELLAMPGRKESK